MQRRDLLLHTSTKTNPKNFGEISFSPMNRLSDSSQRMKINMYGDNRDKNLMLSLQNQQLNIQQV